MTVSHDSQAVLLLCGHLGAPSGSGPPPLTAREWHALAAKIHDGECQRPSALLGVTTGDLATRLGVDSAEAERLAGLLDRGAALAVDLERLESLGIWVLTRADETYPQRYRQRLQAAAPPVLFGAGPVTLLGQVGLAVVGSRDASETARAVATFAGSACADCGWAVYSGGARGVDGLAMTAALGNGGSAVGVVADSLERAIRGPAVRDALADGRLTLVTPYHPRAGFTVGAAMGRNKLIYALADYALVVSCEAERGGTWAGAVEALRARWVPVFAADGAGLPEGNRRLLQRGAAALPWPFVRPAAELRPWLAERVATCVSQPTLF